MIRLRQTGRTNDRPRNRMITTVNTARRIPDLANVRISGKTVRRRLRESGIRARRPVVGPNLKLHHRTASLTWARGCRRWKFYTLQHIFFSDESRFSLRFSDGRYLYIASVGHVLQTSVCAGPTVLEAEVLWSGLKFLVMVTLSSKLFTEH